VAEERTAVTADSAAALELPPAAEYHGKLSDLARDYVAALRDDAERAVWSGESGNATALRITAGVDRLVRFIVEVESLRFAQRYARGTQQRCAVIAQGGYGRSDMSPWSDVDLLVVYPGRMSPYVETVTERLIQTLFDGQLQVGWAVRTLRDCLEQAAQDLTIKTTMFDSRLVAGAERSARSLRRKSRKSSSRATRRASSRPRAASSTNGMRASAARCSCSSRT
jgi:UTP:GlnB (protein PII) uridylyltransferase